MTKTKTLRSAKNEAPEINHHHPTTNNMNDFIGNNIKIHATRHQANFIAIEDRVRQNDALVICLKLMSSSMIKTIVE